MDVEGRIKCLQAIGATQVPGCPIPTYTAVYTPAWTAAQLEAYVQGTAGMKSTETFGTSPASTAMSLGEQLGQRLLLLLDITGYLRSQNQFIPVGVNAYVAFGC